MAPIVPPRSSAAGTQLRAGLVPSLERVLPDSDPGPALVSVSGAGGEWVSYQVALRAEPSLGCRRVEVRFSDLVSEDREIRIPNDSLVVYEERTVRVERSSPGAMLSPGRYPDVLVPVGRLPAVLEFGSPETRALWVDLRVPRGTPAGTYVGEVTASCGGLSIRMEVRLRVFGFDLPRRRTLKSMIGLNERPMVDYYGLEKWTPEGSDLIRKGYELLLEHGVSPGFFAELDYLYEEISPSTEAPYGATVEEALRRYVDVMGATTVFAPIWEDWPPEPLTRNRSLTLSVLRFLDDLLGSRGWGPLYVYTVDEPWRPGDWARARTWGELVDEASPRVRYLLTSMSPGDAPGGNPPAAVGGTADTWVLQTSGYPDLDPQALREIFDGAELWAYTALEGEGTPDWFIDNPPAVYRLFPWLARRYGLSGILYWSADYWVDRDPWEDPAYEEDGEAYNGEGLLIYPCTQARCGFDGPVPSIRLKWLRDGMEDHDYLVLADLYGVGDVARRALDTVARSWTDWESDPDEIEAAREALGEAIEEAARSPDLNLTDRVRAAADFILSLQNGDGAIRDAPGWDTANEDSNAEYAMMGLVAAYWETGDPKYLEAVRRGLRWLASLQEEDGSWYVAYSADPPYEPVLPGEYASPGVEAIRGVDSTSALFPYLLYLYFSASGDAETLRNLLPAAERAANFLLRVSLDPEDGLSQSALILSGGGWVQDRTKYAADQADVYLGLRAAWRLTGNATYEEAAERLMGSVWRFYLPDEGRFTCALDQRGNPERCSEGYDVSLPQGYLEWALGVPAAAERSAAWLSREWARAPPGWDGGYAVSAAAAAMGVSRLWGRPAARTPLEWIWDRLADRESGGVTDSPTSGDEYSNVAGLAIVASSSRETMWRMISFSTAVGRRVVAYANDVDWDLSGPRLLEAASSAGVEVERASSPAEVWGSPVSAVLGGPEAIEVSSKGMTTNLQAYLLPERLGAELSADPNLSVRFAVHRGNSTVYVLCGGDRWATARSLELDLLPPEGADLPGLLLLSGSWPPPPRRGRVGG